MDEAARTFSSASSCLGAELRNRRVTHHRQSRRRRSPSRAYEASGGSRASSARATVCGTGGPWARRSSPRRQADRRAEAASAPFCSAADEASAFGMRNPGRVAERRTHRLAAGADDAAKLRLARAAREDDETSPRPPHPAHRRAGSRKHRRHAHDPTISARAARPRFRGRVDAPPPRRRPTAPRHLGPPLAERREAGGKWDATARRRRAAV